MQQRGELLDPAMVEQQVESEGVGIVGCERRRIPNERAAFGHLVVLDVPTSGPLLVEKTPAPLVKYLPLAVSLSTDRIVSKDEAYGKDLAIGETDVVAAA